MNLSLPSVIDGALDDLIDGLPTSIMRRALKTCSKRSDAATMLTVREIQQRTVGTAAIGVPNLKLDRL